MESSSLYADRIAQVCRSMKLDALDALIISDPQSIWYLTGIWNEPYERMYVFYLTADGCGTLFLNKLFNIPPCRFEEIWTTDSDDAVQTIASRTAQSGTVGIDKSWPARFLIPLMQYNKDVHYVLGSGCVDSARACKDSAEQQLMKDASSINDACMQRGLAYIREGITEKDAAAYIDMQFRKEGADGPCFETIVSYGANAADPHHEPGSATPSEGCCVLIDMGCRKNHYCSDMTRTCFFGSVSAEDAALHDIVRAANEKAESIIRPGVRLCDIDAAARNLIAEAGYGEFFTHRLGHFIGQSDHEQGDVSAANTAPVKPGMIFSIEPGIYLPGRIGIRVEDLVLVTGSGCEVLNHADKKYAVLHS